MQVGRQMAIGAIKRAVDVSRGNEAAAGSNKERGNIIPIKIYLNLIILHFCCRKSSVPLADGLLISKGKSSVNQFYSSVKTSKNPLMLTTYVAI